jgi:hypothetical protein
MRSKLEVCLWLLLAAVVGCDGGSGDDSDGTRSDAAADDDASSEEGGAGSESCTPYTEKLAELAPVTDLQTNYSAETWYEATLALLERRYPAGQWIVASLDDSKNQAKFWMDAGGGVGAFSDIVQSLGLTVHEMNHQLGFQLGVATSFDTYAFPVDAERTIEVAMVPTFDRSEIAASLPPRLQKENNSYFFYLEGNLGAQSFYTLLDELNAYTHSLFVAYGVRDLFSPGISTSDRDGLLTFMAYTLYYLRYARETKPEAHAALLESAENRAMLQSLWERAVFIEAATRNEKSLEIRAAEVFELVADPELYEEIEPFLDCPVSYP